MSKTYDVEEIIIVSFKHEFQCLMKIKSEAFDLIILSVPKTYISALIQNFAKIFAKIGRKKIPRASRGNLAL